MAKWIHRDPEHPLIYQPTQFAFLDAKNSRCCPKCGHEWVATLPDLACPLCHTKGARRFNKLIIIAGRRFGKSRIGAAAGGQEATVPRSIGWACAPTNPKLHRYVIPAFQEVIPEDWVTNFDKDNLDLWLKNGALIHFQTLEDPDQGRGQGLDWLYVDECCELSAEHWAVIRPSLAGDTVAFFTTTPRGKDWVYKDLFQPAQQGVPGFWAAHAKTSDSANPRISAEFLATERSQMSDEFFRQEYEADFVTFQGAVFGDLMNGRVLHTDEEVRKILPEWPDLSGRQVLIGLDTGADHPFGAVKVVTSERGLVVVGEYLKRDGAYATHAGDIKRLAGSPTARYACNKNERQGMIELAQHGIFCQGSENDQVAGIERVKSWLHAKQMWFVEATCPNTIEQMRNYRWAESKANDGSLRKEKVYKLDDELPDCLRYVCMTYPLLPQAKPEVEAVEKRIAKIANPEMRASVERLRRLEGRESIKTEVVSDEDFWA